MKHLVALASILTLISCGGSESTRPLGIISGPIITADPVVPSVPEPIVVPDPVVPDPEPIVILDPVPEPAPIVSVSNTYWHCDQSLADGNNTLFTLHLKEDATYRRHSGYIFPNEGSANWIDWQGTYWATTSGFTTQSNVGDALSFSYADEQSAVMNDNPTLESGIYNCKNVTDELAPPPPTPVDATPDLNQTMWSCDYVAQDGFSYFMRLNSDLTFDASLTGSNPSADWRLDAGTWSNDGKNLTLNNADGTVLLLTNQHKTIGYFYVSENGLNQCGVITPDEDPEIPEVAKNETKYKVIMSAGQSNAQNKNTKYSAELDWVPGNMIVWTSYDGWQKPDLCNQIWDDHYYPAAQGKCNNHLGFQIAKQVALKYPDHTVALIPTGEDGMSIYNWTTEGAKARDEYYNKMYTALEALDSTVTIDLIAFAQGESDNGNPDWSNQFDFLLQNTLKTKWFNESGKFLVPQTQFAHINGQIEALRNDGNHVTDYVYTRDLETKDGVHWNAESLREIGIRFSKYI